MPKFVVSFFFDREHALHQTVEADSASAARAKVVGSLLRENGVALFDVETVEGTFLVPVEGVRFIRIVDPATMPEHRRWKLD